MGEETSKSGAPHGPAAGATRIFGIASVYAVGLCGWAILGLGVLLGSSSVAWPSITGLLLVGCGWSALFGFVGRRWEVLLPLPCLAGLLVTLAILMVSGGPGDGGPAAVAAILLVTAAALLAQVVPFGLGLAMARRVDAAPPARGGGDTH